MKKHTKILLAVIVLAMIMLAGCTKNPTGHVVGGERELNQEANSLKEFNDCLAEQGMVIYGLRTCPACTSLVQYMGGHEAVTSVYVECTVEQQRCSEEARTGFVPEIQFSGEIYQGARSLEAFSEKTGCPLPQ